jgi:hypothetical protein
VNAFICADFVFSCFPSEWALGSARVFFKKVRHGVQQKHIHPKATPFSISMFLSSLPQLEPVLSLQAHHERYPRKQSLFVDSPVRRRASSVLVPPKRPSMMQVVNGKPMSFSPPNHKARRPSQAGPPQQIPSLNKPTRAPRSSAIHFLPADLTEHDMDQPLTAAD